MLAKTRVGKLKHERLDKTMTTIDYQQVAIRSIADALHGDACPVDPDEAVFAAAVYDRAYRDGQNGTYNNRYTETSNE